MPESKSTETYIVVRPHTLNHKVNEEIELTNEQAKALVNKVVIKRSGSDASQKAATDKVNTENVFLKKENEALKAEASELAKANEALVKKVGELTKPADNATKKNSGSK
jgi:hypothetical protein